MWLGKKGNAGELFVFDVISREQIIGFTRIVLFLCVLCHPFDSGGGVNLLFSSNNYGLHGDGPGDSSSLLFDENGVESGHLFTQNISPSGGHVHVTSALGINAPGSDADNAFEPSGAESWTFYWDRNVVLNSISLLRFRIGATPPTSPMVLSIRSDAWMGADWDYTPADTNRVYSFDSISGAFTFAGFPTNTESQTRLTFAPSEVFQLAELYVPTGTSVTFRNDGLPFALMLGMEFEIVPEPPVGTLGIFGLLLFIAARRLKNRDPHLLK
jgi:hypothetical protein